MQYIQGLCQPKLSTVDLAQDQDQDQDQVQIIVSRPVSLGVFPLF
jgi:hypothetical protein